MWNKRLVCFHWQGAQRDSMQAASSTAPELRLLRHVHPWVSLLPFAPYCIFSSSVSHKPLLQSADLPSLAMASMRLPCPWWIGLLDNLSVKRAYSSYDDRGCSLSVPDSRWRSRVDEDVVFLKFLYVLLHLVHLGFKNLLARLLANGVELAVVRLLLVVAHKHLPFLLQGSDKLLTLLLWHQHALTVSLVLLFDLHLTNKVVLVFNLLLDLSHVLRNSAISFLLEKVLLFGSRQFRS